MRNKFVKFSFDLFCDWKRQPPTYRIYVNNELFTERSYIWGGTQYLQEVLQLSAPPGKYSIRIDNLGDPECQFKIRNLNIDSGTARVIDSKTIEVSNEG